MCEGTFKVCKLFPVIVLLTIVSSCVTDCNFNIVRCHCNGPVREVSP